MSKKNYTQYPVSNTAQTPARAPLKKKDTPLARARVLPANLSLG